MHNEFKTQGFTVLAVNCWGESADELRKFAQKNNLGYPMLLNGQTAAKAWGVTGLPDNFLVDRSGKIVAKHVVINDKTLSKVQSRIKRLLN